MTTTARAAWATRTRRSTSPRARPSPARSPTPSAARSSSRSRPARTAPPARSPSPVTLLARSRRRRDRGRRPRSGHLHLGRGRQGRLGPGRIVCDDSDDRDASSGDVGTRTATFKLDPGETVTCVFINAQRGTITIIKDAQPNDAQDFHYDFTGLEGPVAFNLDDDGTRPCPIWSPS